MSELKKTSMFRKALDAILNIGITFFSCILLFLLVVNFQTMFLDKDYNNVFGYSFFEITTGSMSPEIEIGDWIIVQIDKENIAINDIITYQEGEAFVTHRVTGIYGDVIQTKGDANNTSDSAITRNQIVGKLVKILPRFGILKKIFLNPKLLVIFILILLVLCSLLDTSFDQRVFNFIKQKCKEGKLNKKEIKKQLVNVKPKEESLKQEEVMSVYKIKLDSEINSTQEGTELFNLDREEINEEDPLSKTSLLSNLTIKVKNTRVINLNDEKTKY